MVVLSVAVNLPCGKPRILLSRTRMCQDLLVGPGWGRLGLFQACVLPLREGDETYALVIQPLTDAVTLRSA